MTLLPKKITVTSIKATTPFQMLCKTKFCNLSVLSFSQILHSTFQEILLVPLKKQTISFATTQTPTTKIS